MNATEPKTDEKEYATVSAHVEKVVQRAAAKAAKKAAKTRGKKVSLSRFLGEIVTSQLAAEIAEERRLSAAPTPSESADASEESANATHKAS